MVIDKRGFGISVENVGKISKPGMARKTPVLSHCVLDVTVKAGKMLGRTENRFFSFRQRNLRVDRRLPIKPDCHTELPGHCGHELDVRRVNSDGIDGEG